MSSFDDEQFKIEMEAAEKWQSKQDKEEILVNQYGGEGGKELLMQRGEIYSLFVEKYLFSRSYQILTIQSF